MNSILLDRIEDSLQHFGIKVIASVAAPQVADKLLHRHGDVELFGIVVVLVHVQHDDGIGETEGCIRVSKRISIAFLQND